MALRKERTTRTVRSTGSVNWFRARNVDMMIGIVIPVVLVASNTITPSSTSPGRAVLGLLATLVLPGYFFIEAISPRRSDVGDLARWVLVIVMNPAIIIVTSLFVSLAHQHVRSIVLDASDTTVAVCSVIVIFDVAAWWRRYRLLPGEAVGSALPRGWAPLGTLVFAAIVGGVTWVVVGSNLGNHAPEMALTNPAGGLSGYPFQLHQGEIYPLRLLITNPTGAPVQYRLEVRDQNRKLREQTVAISAHGSWSHQALLPSDTVGQREVVSYELFAGGRAIRRVSVTYRVIP